jgi:hypothetical protein
MGQFDHLLNIKGVMSAGEGAQPTTMSPLAGQGGPARIVKKTAVNPNTGEPVKFEQNEDFVSGGPLAPLPERGDVKESISKAVTGKTPAQRGASRTANRRFYRDQSRRAAVSDPQPEADRRAEAPLLETTTMRMVNGKPTDMDYGRPAPVIAGTHPRPINTSAKPADWQGTDNPLSAEDAARAMDPGKSAREAKYAADASTEAERLDMIQGEAAFNASGGNLRSLNGITYDASEFESKRQTGLRGASDGGFHPAAYDEYEKDVEHLRSAADANDVIPKSPYTKAPVDPKNQDDYRPSSVVPTDMTKLDEGDEDRAKIDDSGREVGDSDLTTDAPVKGPTLNTAAKEAKELTPREKEVKETEDQLQSAGQEDYDRERRLKGKRGEMFDENDSPLPDSKPSRTKYEGPRQFETTVLAGPTAVVENDIPGGAYERVGTTDKKTGKTVYSEGSNLDPLFDDPNTILSTTMREVPAEGPAEAVTTQSDSRTPVTFDKSRAADPRVIPQPLLDTDIDEGKTDAELDREYKGRARNRVPSGARGTSAVDGNETMAKGNRGRTEESAVTDRSRMAERNAKLGGVTTHAPEVVKTAQSLGISAGLTSDEVNDPLFHQSTHMTKALVMHESGNADNPAAVDAHLGGNPLEANQRLNAAYSTLSDRKRFRDTSKPGTGYTYHFDAPEGGGKVNDTDYFKTRDGQEVPMSNTMHPEHPLANGKVMEGSSVTFKGLIKNPDGTNKYSRDTHQGWAPYNRGGKRVFEYNDIPEGSIHEGDLTEAQINGGVTTPALQRGLNKGKDTGVELAGQSVSAAPAAPIKGAPNPDDIPTFTPTLAEKYPRVLGGTTGDSTPAPDTRALKAVKYHENHVASGINKVGCKYCTSKASRASREGAADAAQDIGDQIITAGVTVAQAGRIGAPLPKAGVARRNVGEPLEKGVRESLTDAEQETKNSPALRRDDSKILVPTSPATTPEKMPKKARNTPAATLGGRLKAEPGIHGSMGEIDEAAKSGAISYDEARELAVSAGHLPGMKSQFAPGGEDKV